MKFREDLTASGHPAIKATHRTTLELTKEKHLTPRGDCVIAVDASKGAADLAAEFKQAARSLDAVITLTLCVGNNIEIVKGRGHPALSFTHPSDLVVRKSSYICPRTLMVQADRAAADLKRMTVAYMKSSKMRVSIQLTVTTVGAGRCKSGRLLPPARRAELSA